MTRTGTLRNPHKTHTVPAGPLLPHLAFFCKLGAVLHVSGQGPYQWQRRPTFLLLLNTISILREPQQLLEQDSGAFDENSHDESYSREIHKALLGKTKFPAIEDKFQAIQKYQKALRLENLNRTIRNRHACGTGTLDTLCDIRSRWFHISPFNAQEFFRCSAAPHAAQSTIIYICFWHILHH